VEARGRPVRRRRAVRVRASRPRAALARRRRGVGGGLRPDRCRASRRRMSKVRVGLSGWNYGHWRGGVFYPPRLPASRWLEFYAERFDTVEVNSTFYRLPRVDAVARWIEQTPADFLFSVKASRYLTHIKRLRELGPGLERFLERIEPLLGSPKLGPLLWQLPHTFRRDDERLADALARLPRELRHCIEFRDPSWFVEDTYALLREHGVALAIGD